MHFTDVRKAPIYFERLVSKAVNYFPFCIFVLKGEHCKWIPLSTACTLCHPAEKWKGQFQFCEARIFTNNSEINIKASNWVCSRCGQIKVTNLRQCMTILNRKYQSHHWPVVITAISKCYMMPKIWSSTCWQHVVRGMCWHHTVQGPIIHSYSLQCCVHLHYIFVTLHFSLQ